MDMGGSFEDVQGSFEEYSGLFGGYTGLFCGYTGLFCRYMGLFCGHRGLQQGMISSALVHASCTATCGSSRLEGSWRRYRFFSRV